MSGRLRAMEAESPASDLGSAVLRKGAVDRAAEGRNAMVNAERMCLDEAGAGGVPWRRWGLRTRGRGAVTSAAAGQRTGAAR
jgi:hypothetical protein